MLIDFEVKCSTNYHLEYITLSVPAQTLLCPLQLTLELPSSPLPSSPLLYSSFLSSPLLFLSLFSSPLPFSLLLSPPLPFSLILSSSPFLTSPLLSSRPLFSSPLLSSPLFSSPLLSPPFLFFLTGRLSHFSEHHNADFRPGDCDHRSLQLWITLSSP